MDGVSLVHRRTLIFFCYVVDLLEPRKNLDLTHQINTSSVAIEADFASQSCSS